jgi:hypothetical protein
MAPFKAQLDRIEYRVSSLVERVHRQDNPPCVPKEIVSASDAVGLITNVDQPDNALVDTLIDALYRNESRSLFKFFAQIRSSLTMLLVGSSMPFMS